MGHLYCGMCDAKYELDDPRWKCDCGSYLDIEFEPNFDPVAIATGPRSLWRYRKAIPIRDDSDIVSLDEGFTPLADLVLDGNRVKVKLDHLCPTGSFKDRGASVLVSRLKEIGVTRVVEDSSGNAGSALAAYCSRAGIECAVFVPEAARPDKVALIRSHGAEVRTVAGDREDTAAAALEAAESTYYASHVWSPYFLQGTKTFAYEICEQLGWRAPDSVVLPVGNGTLLLGAFTGFKELLAAGFIGMLPRLIGVQSSKCNPIARAYENGWDQPRPVPTGATIADGIAVAAPLRGKQILEAVTGSGGSFISVEDAEIEAAREEVGRTGYSVEPTAAAAPAAIMRRRADSGIIVTTLSGADGKPMAGRSHPRARD
ncbi:MAG: threonine synthase [bacterium]